MHFSALIPSPLPAVQCRRASSGGDGDVNRCAVVCAGSVPVARHSYASVYSSVRRCAASNSQGLRLRESSLPHGLPQAPRPPYPLYPLAAGPHRPSCWRWPAP